MINNEPEKAIPKASETGVIPTFILEKQLKQCGHFCFPSTTQNCCPCSDLRPHLEGNTYPIYIDGHGWRDSGSRDEGYCPVCNPRNYDNWITIIEQKHNEKEAQKQQIKLILEREDKNLHDDIIKIDTEIGNGFGEFTYANGDEYKGEFLNGLRHGEGTIIYAADKSIYEGRWKFNQQHGFGRKNWGDGITYVGEWEYDQMHGKGTYTMSCGTVIEGMFERDEFAE